MQVSWFSPRQQQSAVQLLTCSSPCSGMGKRIGRKRQNSWVGIRQFNRAAKEEKNNNNTAKKNIQSNVYTMQLVHHSMPSLLLSSDSLPSQLPQFCTEHDIIRYERSRLTSLGQLSWLCPLPASCENYHYPS